MIHYFIYAGAALLIWRLLRRNAKLNNRCGKLAAKIMQLNHEANELRAVVEEYEEGLLSRENKLMFRLTNPNPEDTRTFCFGPLPEKEQPVPTGVFNKQRMQEITGLPDSFFDRKLLHLINVLKTNIRFGGNVDLKWTEMFFDAVPEVKKRKLLEALEKDEQFEMCQILSNHLNKQP